MSSKSVIKHHTTRRYTTLWNVCAQKSHWPTAEWSETQPFKTVAPRY